MSRIGKQPVTIPSGVTVVIEHGEVVIKGPKGSLTLKVHPLIEVAVEGSEIICRVKRQTKETPALWGTTRAHVANMVTGVTAGFRKQLELQGVGYRGALKGRNLELALGFSHPVTITPPEGITFIIEKEFITIEGTDITQVGQVAANIRKVRPPEPYKGKGVRYVGEKVRRKVGKVVGTTS